MAAGAAGQQLLPQLPTRVSHHCRWKGLNLSGGVQAGVRIQRLKLGMAF